MEALVIPLVLALMLAIKQMPIFAPDPPPAGPRKLEWLIPWVSALVGVGCVFLYAQAFGDAAGNWALRVLNGIVFGLAASGLYKGGPSQAIKAISGG